MSRVQVPFPNRFLLYSSRLTGRYYFILSRVIYASFDQELINAFGAKRRLTTPRVEGFELTRRYIAIRVLFIEVEWDKFRKIRGRRRFVRCDPEIYNNRDTPREFKGNVSQQSHITRFKHKICEFLENIRTQYSRTMQIYLARCAVSIRYCKAASGVRFLEGRV